MSRFWFGQEVLMSRANNVAIGIRKHNIQWYNCTVEVTHRILLAKKTRYDFDPLQAKFKEIQRLPCEGFPFILPFLITSVTAARNQNPMRLRPKKACKRTRHPENPLRSTFQ